MRIAVIVLRYGENVVGGAERLALGFSEAAAQRGWPIEVWTTCAKSHYTWENVYPAGAEIIRGVLVRRFPITGWDHWRRSQLESRLNMLRTLSITDQYDWLETGAHSAPLYRHAVEHADEFDVLMVLPYALPLSHYAAWSAIERTVLLPCLHNEAYAYLEVSRLLMENVQGVIFNSLEERDLAIEVLGIQTQRHAVLGAGVRLELGLGATEIDPGRDLLYIGRLEHGKNVHSLYQYVQRYVDDGGDLRLVVAGDGPVKPPSHPAFHYRGFVSEAEKATACASALALCQPSANESFSFTIMESWVNARPVLVHGDCAVTQGHVRRCRGGLWFRDYDEFVGAVEWLKDNPDLASRMGRNGRDYVCSNFTWEAIVDRFDQIMTGWQSPNAISKRTAA